MMPLRKRYRPPIKTKDGVRKGHMWAKIGKVAAVLAACVGEIARGAGLGLQN
jgi:hypothetical protein